MSEFLKTAEFLGAKLVREAIWDGERCNWFGWPVTELRSGRPVVVQRMSGPDFYYGTSGIAFFLAHLYSATGEHLFRRTSECAMRQAMSRLDDIPTAQRLSFQSGLIGIAYALFNLARLCEIEKFNQIGLFILEEACNDIDNIEFDSTSISALLSMHREQPKDFILRTAVSLGENSEATPQGLLDLFQHTGEERFRKRAEEQLNVEPCVNGKLPTVLAGLRALQVLKNDIYVEKAQAALCEITESFDRPSDFSLGSGLAAQADTLIEAARILDNSDYYLAANRIAGFGIDQYRKDNLPWPCFAPDKSETPGLMNGLAGVGYMYLRLFDNSKHSSVRFS